MSDKKPCLRCDRPIDAVARICPYCNWDQHVKEIPPPKQSSAPVYVPPSERNWRRHIMMFLAGIALLAASFGIGALINSDDTPKVVESPLAQNATAAPVGVPKRADVTLVPVTEMDAPITTAPVSTLDENTPAEYQRSDATAVSSVEYAQLAARAQDEKKRPTKVVDPRSLTGPAYAQAPPRRVPPVAETPVTPAPTPGESSADADRARDGVDVPERARVVERTRPVPISQPIPSISVNRTVVARLELTVGADGRVTAVNLRESIPGHTAEIISAVQKWRFKPATENGVPVSAPFSVDISFSGND
ncbi:MAG: TonB family protein [Thermoanaerobaculia bacterium]|nr:TonB family protein [Thermoanaerobaculia bacterium]